jgi:hypothetical protein
MHMANGEQSAYRVEFDRVFATVMEAALDGIAAKSFERLEERVEQATLEIIERRSK